MTAPERLVNGKTWTERWADVRAGTGCICGQPHDRAPTEPPDRRVARANPRA